MAPRAKTVVFSTVDDVKDWLRNAMKDYRWNVRGILLKDNTILPLPKEPALVAKVIEVTVTEHLKRKASSVPGLDVFEDESGRAYPDKHIDRNDPPGSSRTARVNVGPCSARHVTLEERGHVAPRSALAGSKLSDLSSRCSRSVTLGSDHFPSQ